jgi:hypothetical protein
VIPLAFSANLLDSPNVEAADRFGVVGIENATNVTVSLQHRWGDGQWAAAVGGNGTSGNIGKLTKTHKYAFKHYSEPQLYRTIRSEMIRKTH